VLQAGLYLINSTITLNADAVSIIGAGSSPCDAAGGLPTTGTRLLWTGATLTGCMMLGSTPGHPIGCRYEGFSLFGGSAVGTQKAVGMRFGGGAHCSIRDMAFCNFSSVALDMYSASGDPTDTIKGPNHFSIDNVHIDVGSLYWQAYSGMALSPSTAIGFRNEVFDYGDFFCSTITNMFVIHNYVGVWMGNSDNNTFVGLQTYGYPNSIGPLAVAASPQRGLFITDNSRTNRVIGCTSQVVAINNTGPSIPAQCSIYDLDVLNPGSIANAISVATNCEVMFTVGSLFASGGAAAGDYYAGPNSGTSGLYSMTFNESLGKISLTNRSGTVTSF
ncbi:MAG TPA: hypothetical protein VHQ21_09185, partial [Rhodanobacteraceae bacterium]|nr:hypothetical protein [Rhodanobacteraceae bacterium]